MAWWESQREPTEAKGLDCIHASPACAESSLRRDPPDQSSGPNLCSVPIAKIVYCSPEATDSISWTFRPNRRCKKAMGWVWLGHLGHRL